MNYLKSTLDDLGRSYHIRFTLDGKPRKLFVRASTDIGALFTVKSLHPTAHIQEITSDRLLDIH